MDLKFLDFEQPIAELEAKIEELRFVGDDSEININEEVRRLRAKSEALTKSIMLRLAPNGQGEQLLMQLHDLLLPYREGNCEVAVQYFGNDAKARLELGSEWSVRPSRELRDKLGELLGSNNVRLLYAPGREIM